MKKALFFWGFLVMSLLLFCSCNGVTPGPEEPLDSHLNPDSEYLIVFGDIQEYTADPDLCRYYRLSVEWIQAQLNAGARFVDILESGDVTWGNFESQWDLFRKATETIAAKIPYFVCIGNHDYDWDSESKIRERSSTRINAYCHFPLSDAKILAYYSGTGLENYVAQLSDARRTRLLVLELGTRPEVLEWARQYVNGHPDDRFILMTHEWLSEYGQRISTGSYAEMHFAGYSTYCTPEEIWNKLVKPNDNIVCVLCGHNGFAGKLFSVNDAGREVPQVLFNLQYQDNGGNGYVQLWEFPSRSDSVKIVAYDTINRDWVMPDSTAVTFRFNY